MHRGSTYVDRRVAINLAGFKPASTSAKLGPLRRQPLDFQPLHPGGTRAFRWYSAVVDENRRFQLDKNAGSHSELRIEAQLIGALPLAEAGQLTPRCHPVQSTTSATNPERAIGGGCQC